METITSKPPKFQVILLFWMFCGGMGLSFSYHVGLGLSLTAIYLVGIPFCGALFYWMIEDHVKTAQKQTDSYQNALIWPGFFISFVLFIIWEVLVKEVFIGSLRWTLVNLLGLAYFMVIFTPFMIFGNHKVKDYRLTKFFVSNLQYCKDNIADQD